MCHLKRLFIITLLSLLVIEGLAYGKKTRKSKRPRADDEETTPQPNVVTYSTFGFNDVGSTYDGFVPSSPDYASYLSNYNQNLNQESSTRLYAPAFPTAMDNNNEYVQAQEPQNFPVSGVGGGEQAAMLQYDPNSFNFANPTSFGQTISENKNENMQDDDTYDQNSDDYSNPVYGAKISSKNRNKPPHNLNSTILFGNSPFNPNEDRFTSYQYNQPQQESKPAFGESTSNSFNYYNYAPNFEQTNGDEATPAVSNVATSSIKFSKYLDFTKFKPSYPTELDTKYATGTVKPTNSYDSMTNSHNENSYSNSYFHSENENNPLKFKDHLEQNESDKGSPSKPTSTNYLEFSVNHVDSKPTKSANNKNVKPVAEYKDKFKSQPWNYSVDYNNWKNSLKNNDYSSDWKNNSFRRPYKSNTEEVTSASNHVIDLTNYRFPESDFSGLKKVPEYKPEAFDTFPSINSFRYQEKLVQQGENEYYNQFKNIYSTVPTTTTRWGGNLFKPEPGPFRGRPKRPSLSEDEVVHIPKRNKYHIKHGGKTSEWSAHTRHVPYKGKPLDEWNKEVLNRFKNEEDLLGLRNHDTSHPQYLPTFKLTNEVGDEFKKYMSEKDYKNLVEKWRQSYIKSKYFNKESGYRDNEPYGSESRPMHVPIPKPYPIEVPHPVIVPVPQPYPVRVPVPKPVAIPVVKELTVPIEKPVPYPVIKKVPYPVEKLVPVPVEREVAVPVIKPYAVPIPHMRPVFHHSRPALDEYEPELDDEDDYLPRPAETSNRGKKPAKYYNKKPKSQSTRHRSRRPSHSTQSHYERNNRRPRKPTPSRTESTRSRRRPTPPPSSHPDWNYPPSFKYHEDDEEYDHDHNDYFDYCKRNGNC